MRDFSQNIRKQQEIRLRPAADKVYCSVFGDSIKIARFDSGDNFVLDKTFAVDVVITLPYGLTLNGQEKFLSTQNASYQSVTVEYYQNQFTHELGDWFKLGVQLYFVGYEFRDTFKPYVLLNWPSVVMATITNKITWTHNNNKDGHARASFTFCKIAQIPRDCIIAIG